MEATHAHPQLDLGLDCPLPAAKVAPVSQAQPRVRAGRRYSWTALAARGGENLAPTYLSDDELREPKQPKELSDEQYARYCGCGY